VTREEFKSRLAEITSGMSLSSLLRWPFTGQRLRVPTTSYEYMGPDFETETWRQNGLCLEKQGRRRCFGRAGHDGPHDFDEVNKRLNAEARERLKGRNP
jgi:hypothetical protein